MKTLYHGSKDIIENPKYGYGSKYNDYGLGFYCTEDINMAKEWGVGKNRDGYANCYEIDTSDLKILDLNDFTILQWLTILLENRLFESHGPLAIEAKQYLKDYFSIPYEKYDIIVGYRADDSYFSFAEDFINGAISLRQLNNAMHLGKLGQQFVLKSKKAFNKIQFKGYEVADSKEWYNKKILRDQSARSDYFDVERNKRERGDIYITSILDEEMKPSDLRIRQNLSR